MRTFRHDAEPPRREHLTLRASPDFNFKATLAYFAARAVPEIEQVGPHWYERTVGISGDTYVMKIDFANLRCGAIRVSAPGVDLALHSEAIRATAVAIFDLEADTAAIESHISADPTIGRVVSRQRAVGIPGAPDPFEVAVRAVLGQQISVRSAARLVRSLTREYGRPTAGEPVGPTRAFPAAEDLAEADLSHLGVPRQRAGAIVALAQEVASGRLVLSPAKPAAALESLLRIRGIGPWTASYVALRGLKCGDAFPASDLGLRAACSDSEMPLTTPALLARAERWRPWRGYAAVHLWTSLLAGSD